MHKTYHLIEGKVQDLSDAAGAVHVYVNPDEPERRFLENVVGISRVVEKSGEITQPSYPVPCKHSPKRLAESTLIQIGGFHLSLLKLQVSCS